MRGSVKALIEPTFSGSLSWRLLLLLLLLVPQLLLPLICAQTHSLSFVQLPATANLLFGIQNQELSGITPNHSLLGTKMKTQMLKDASHLPFLQSSCEQ